MAIAIASNGIWTRSRLYDAGMVDDDMRPRCNFKRETPYHRYWERPANCLIENQFPLKSSDKYDAPSNASKESALLTRGIVLVASYLKIPPPTA